MLLDLLHGKPMSNVDAAWLRMDDPTNLMTITAVMSFYDKLDFAELKSLVEDRLLCYDRFRRRVVEPSVPFGRPRWVDDRHFNLRSHLQRVALPDPGGQHELQDMVSNLMSTPLDASKPLWQMQYIENYRGGSAIVARIHHCIADGIALVRVLLSMTDEAPGVPTRRRRRPRPPLLGGFWLPEVVNTTLYSATKITETLIEEGSRAVLDPNRAFELIDEGRATAAVLKKLALMCDDPDTVLRGPLTTSKRCAWSKIMSLADVKAVGKKLGGTINDVLLTGVAGALRRYIASRGDSVAGLDLRAAVPVNLRPDDKIGALGNKFGLVFLSLPVGIVDRQERLIELRRRMNELKGSAEPGVAFGILNALGMASPDIESLAVSILGRRATAVMTNVPGPKKEIYLAGKAMRSLMFWVPQAGRLGLGVSIISYAGQVRLGVTTDSGLVPEPSAIVDEFQAEMNELLDDHLAPGERSEPPAAIA
jgi:WS/DGAT/MGAT family acyltransferase